MNASSLPSHKFVGFFFLLLLFYPFLFYYFSYLFCNWKSPGISLTTSQDDSETLTTQQRVPVPTWVPLESDKSLGCALTSQKHRPGTSVCSFPSFRLPRGGGRQASNDTKGKGSTGRVTLANSNNSSWLWKQPSHPKRSFFFFFPFFPPKKQEQLISNFGQVPWPWASSPHCLSVLLPNDPQVTLLNATGTKPYRTAKSKYVNEAWIITYIMMKMFFLCYCLCPASFPTTLSASELCIAVELKHPRMALKQEESSICRLVFQALSFSFSTR